MAVTLEKRLERYRLRIDNAKRFRQQEGFDDLWERLVEMYSGKQFELNRKEDQIAVNIAKATVDVIGPAISVNHPKVTVNARDPEDDDRAVIAEAVLSYWWKAPRFGIRPEFRLAVKDFLIVGHGWVKTGYRLTQNQVPLGEEELKDSFAQARGEADQYAAENPEMAASLPTNDEIYGSLPSTKAVVTDNRPFAERVSFWDMYVDPESTTLRDARWVAQRIVRPVEDCKNDSKYDKAVANKLRGETGLTTKWTGDDKQRSRQGDDIQRVIIWEFYDLKANEVSVFSEQSKGFLVKPTKIPYDFGHPFVMIRNYDVPNQFYPMGDLEAIEPLQRELNKTRSQLMNLRKQYGRKILYRKSSFTPAGRNALESPYDKEFVEVVESDVPLDSLTHEVQTTSPAPELYNYSAQIQNDIDVVSGVSDYQRGASPDIRRTATEASIIQDSINARSADKLSIIEASIADIGSNLLCLARQFLTGDQVARIVGKAGQQIWVPYEHDDLDFDADFEVEGGSTMPKNEAFRQNQALQMLQTMTPFVGTFINPQELIRFVLQAFDVKNPESFLIDPETAMMMQMQQQGGAPPADGSQPPQGGPPADGAVGVGAPSDAATALPGGLDPQLLAQLAGQVGLNVPGTDGR